MKRATKKRGLSRIPAIEEILSVSGSRTLPVIAWSDERSARGRKSGALAQPDLVTAFGAACEYIRSLETALAKVARTISR